MNEKSHVSLERRVCLVCGISFDSGALLLDTRLRASLERYTTTGWGLCPEHQQRFDEGFVALIECDPQRSGAKSGSNHIKPEDAYRTGCVAHLKREVFAQVFDVALDASYPCVFVEPGVIDQLKAKVRPAAF